MTSTNIQDFYQVVNNDICDCDQRCAKCGKLKRQQLTTYPNYPIYPTQPTNPWQPWITYTITSTYPCTHQE